MKKLATLLLAAGMVVASTAPANAVDIKVDGRYRVSFATRSQGFEGQNMETAQQRFRLGLTMAASENLSGYVQFEHTKQRWGTTTDTNGEKDVRTRMAYIDWIVPATSIKVRMGRQALGLPADAFGCSSVMDAGWGSRDGIVVSSPVTDWLSLDALWVRADASDAGKAAGAGADLDQAKNTDVFAAVANLKFEGLDLSVYGSYAALDAGTGFRSIVTDGLPNIDGDAYWAGATATLSYFDPFTLKLSGAWGEANGHDAAGESLNQNGWNVQAKASYATAFGTPVLGGWYFSGNDKGDVANNGTMPSVGGYFIPTTTYHDGAYGITGGQCVYLPTGNWGIQAGIEDVSFVKGLTHSFLVSYMKGTNDKDTAKNYDANGGMYLTEDDSLVEFDLVNTYQIYKNLTAFLELSYIISDFDENVNRGTYAGKLDEDDWRAELTFQYKF